MIGGANFCFVYSACIVVVVVFTEDEDFGILLQALESKFF